MESNNGATSAKPEYQEKIEIETHCCLCGGELEFQHKTDYLLLKIQEDAHCPTCSIRMKSREHTIH
jgi:hypothetical protein